MAVHSDEYMIVRKTLVTMRRDAGLTQRELAQRLDREHSFVWRIETGERRLDVVEFAWVCHALNQDAASVYVQMATRWNVYLPASPAPVKLAAERPARPYGMK